MKWKRPSGTEIETLEDDVTIAHCKSMGWEPVKGNKKIVKKEETRAVRADTEQEPK